MHYVGFSQIGSHIRVGIKSKLFVMTQLPADAISYSIDTRLA